MSFRIIKLVSDDNEPVKDEMYRQRINAILLLQRGLSVKSVQELTGLPKRVINRLKEFA